jgi:hypothetical protein
VASGRRQVRAPVNLTAAVLELSAQARGASDTGEATGLLDLSKGTSS